MYFSCLQHGEVNISELKKITNTNDCLFCKLIQFQRTSGSQMQIHTLYAILLICHSNNRSTEHITLSFFSSPVILQDFCTRLHRTHTEVCTVDCSYSTYNWQFCISFYSHKKSRKYRTEEWKVL